MAHIRGSNVVICLLVLSCGASVAERNDDCVVLFQCKKSAYCLVYSVAIVGCVDRKSVV